MKPEANEDSVGYGYTVIPVLEFLNGKSYDDRALDYLRAVRPSEIRTVQPNGMLTCDACLWRVTVHLEGDKIVKIEQEVEVELRTADNGYCLDRNIPKGTAPWSKDGGISVVNARAVKKVEDKEP